jgi:hypothetical protein
MTRKTTFFASFLVVLASCTPALASAKGLDLYNPKKHYGDEHVAINNPTSRCTTADFQAIYTAAQAQAKKDLASRTAKEGDSAQLHSEYQTYQERLDLGWGAMQQPYCGFGAFGTTAAKHSLQKTISRARDDFFKGVVIPMDLTSTSSTDSADTEPVPPPATPPPVTTAAADSTPAPAVTMALMPTSTSTPSTSHLTRDMHMGDRVSEVKALQELLVRKGYLTEDYATGYFGSHTQQALINFQIKAGIIKSKNSSGAGFAGPRTRAALNG